MEIARFFRVVVFAIAFLASAHVHALIISEVMYHSKEVSDEDFEYIELYNENADPLDLSGYTFCRGLVFTFPAGTWIEGRSCLVVCAVEANIQTKYGISNTVGDWLITPSSANLSNSGESIEICNPGGRVVAEVSYNDRGKWPSGADGVGHSIEIKNPFIEVDDADSWRLSNDPEGSPGDLNPCWGEDDAPPSGLDEGPVGSFDGHVDIGIPCTPGGTTFDAGDYAITGSGLDVWTSGDQCQFAWVQIDGDFDIRARISSRAWGPERWGKGGVMARRDFTASSHYVFVHDNPDPDGARMAHRPTHGGSDNAEPFTTLGHPDWYRLERVGDSITGYHSNDGTTWTEFGTVLWNGTNLAYVGLALTSHSGCTTATLGWDSLQISGTIVPPPPPGPGGQPGVCAPRFPVVINEGLFRTTGDRWVELHNEGGTGLDLSGYHLTDDRAVLTKSTLGGGTMIPAGGYLSFTDVDLALDFSVALPGDQVFVALVEPAGNRVVDAYIFEPEFDEMSEARVPDGDPEFTTAGDPTRDAANSVTTNQDIVINELMYHPIHKDGNKEFIELYNRGGSTVDISGWKITRGVNFLFPGGTTISPGGYLVVGRNPALIIQIHGLSASDVIGPQQTTEALNAFGRLKDSGERVRLRDQLGRVVDTFHYYDGGEWPRWADGHGASLELIDPFQDNRHGQAWDASDDASKSIVNTYEYLGTHGGEDSELHIALLSRGVTLVDNVEVIGGAVSNVDLVVVDDDEVWSYFKGTVEPSPSWKLQGFDDSSWSSGATGIGYGDGDDVTVLTDMQNSYLTVYCRKEFNVADVNDIDELILGITVDDGYFAYLNGTLVESYNVAGANFDDPASTAAEPILIERDITSSKGLLVNGTNVLCVQVHNGNYGSSDLSFIPKLINRTSTVTGGTNQVVNGTFDSDTSGWMLEGTHVRSGRTTAQPISGAGSLKVVASGRGDNKVNRIETTNAGMNLLNTNEQYVIRFDARWLIGSSSILTHGYRHAMAMSHSLAVPENLGTPGQQNSVSARLIADTGVWNQGPVFSKIKQDPAVPEDGQAVTVTVTVTDSDGVSSVDLHYSLNNPSGSPTTVAMTSLGGDEYEAVIPGQTLGTKVVFHCTATDTGARVGRYPIDVRERTHPLVLDPANPGLDELRYFVYRYAPLNPATNFHNYRFWMTDNEESRLDLRRRLSNDLVHGSFVFGGGTIYHEAKTRFSGSPWARGEWGGSFRVVLPRGKPLHDKFRKFNLEDHHGNGGDARERTSHYLIRHAQGSIGVPFSDSQTMVRWQVNDRTTATREHVWVPDTQFLGIWYPDDDNGDFLEMDDRFIIDDNGNRTGNSDGRVLYPPPSSRGDGDGANKENYRWFFGLRSKNGEDGFQSFQDFCQVMDPAVTNDATFNQQIWDFCDVEEMLRIWAVRMNTSDWDTWGTTRGKNCYFFRHSVDGRWRLLAWDMELTYETGRLGSFLPSTNPYATWNPGSFAEVNRLFNQPKIKRMYYGILEEMVGGPDPWFHSDHLSALMGKLNTLGMSNTGIGQAGGYVDQRYDRLVTRISSVISPAIPVEITTNGGADFTSNQPMVDLTGRAPVDASTILIQPEGGLPGEYECDFSDLVTWTFFDIPLVFGDNTITIYGFDTVGNIVGVDTIGVNSTFSAQAPVITSIDPASQLDGQDMDVVGTDFRDGVRVFFGAVEAMSVIYSETGPNPGRITVTVPGQGPGAPSSVPVKVRNVDAQESNTVSFTYLHPAPSIASLAPSAELAGGSIDIIGADFRDGVRVFFGAIEATTVSYSEAGPNPDRITVTVPDQGTGGPDQVAVKVRNVDGQESGTLNFTYLSPSPAITLLDPSSGSVGQTIDIVGTGFQDGVRVFFGAIEAGGVSYSEAGPTPGAITATVPSQGPGGPSVVSVKVRNVDDQESGTAVFTYLYPAPAITLLSPSSQLAGGSIDVDGTSLRDGVRVFFGAKESSSVSYSETGPTPNRLTAMVPAQDPGGPSVVPVKVRNVDDQESGTLSFTYLYVAPAITGVAPGSQLAGQTIRITGTGLRDGVNVFFGAVAATTVSYSETGPTPDTITATVPSQGPGGPALVDVSVENVDGQDSNTAPFTYLYLAPTITSLNPASQLAGGTIDIDGASFLDGVRVFFGAKESPAVVHSEGGPTPGTITATVPSQDPGGPSVVSVKVRNVDDQESNTVTFDYLYDPPTISSLNPASQLAGGTIDIDGASFLDGVRVFFGAKESPAVVHSEAGPTPGTITATVPSQDPGGPSFVSVKVRNFDDQESNTLSFTYLHDAPSITSLDPAMQLAGGTVDVVGTAFRDGVRVFFGTEESANVSYSEIGPTPNRITATVPAHAQGSPDSVQLRVENVDGQSSNNLPFTYLFVAPALTSLDPPSQLEGQNIDVVGSGFREGLRVLFGSVEATGLTFDEAGLQSDTIVATVPPRTPGGPVTVDVKVVNNDAQESNTRSFTYVYPAPTITLIDPALATVGSQVEISGSGLRDGVRVLFGAIESSAVTYSETGPTPGIVFAEVPNGVGTVGVKVINVDDQESNTLSFTYEVVPDPAPVITSLDPASALEGAEIDVVGSSFRDGVRVFFGAVEASSVNHDESGPNPDRITVTVPARVPGGDSEVMVRVVNVDAQASGLVPFTYLHPAPLIDLLLPDQALAATEIEIRGSGFRDGLRVLFGDNEASGVSYSEAGPTPAAIRATVPAKSPGAPAATPVRVVNDGGQESNAVTFTYLFAAPTITSLDPASQLAGSDISIVGTGFLDGLEVFFGGVQASAVSYSEAGIASDRITVTVPDPLVGGPDEVLVRVVNPDGRASNDAPFTYLHPGPTIDSLDPASASAGATISIFGSGLRAGLSVFFGKIQAGDVTLDEAGPDPDRIDVVVPSSIAGADPVVQLRVVNDDGQGSNELPFTYLFPAPSILSLDPVSALAGETVEITGAGFRDGLSVLFGDVPASVVAFSETGATPDRITVTAPAPAPGVPATVDVRVENVDGQESNGAEFTYQYVAPTITALDPAVGVEGDSIEIVGQNLRNGVRVHFGDVEAAEVTFDETGATPDRIVVTVPERNLGDPSIAQVRVQNIDDQLSNELPFRYRLLAPIITEIAPGQGRPDEEVEITGEHLRDGLRVFFGSTESEEVTYDESGPRPDTIVARVPHGTGLVSVYVVNPDDQESDRLPFVILAALVDFIRGDVNRDGETDLADGVTILLYLFQGGSITCEDAADPDDNEEVDITDAIYMLNYLFAGGPPPRAPFPAAGEDPAGEALGCEA